MSGYIRRTQWGWTLFVAGEIVGSADLAADLLPLAQSLAVEVTA